MKPTPILLTVLVALCSVIVPAAFNAAEPPYHTSVPDVRPWRMVTYDESFFQGRTVCGEEALTFMWQSIKRLKRHRNSNQTPATWGWSSPQGLFETAKCIGRETQREESRWKQT